MNASRNSEEGSDGSSVSLPFLAFPKTKGGKENMCVTFLEPMLKRDSSVSGDAFLVQGLNLEYEQLAISLQSLKFFLRPQTKFLQEHLRSVASLAAQFKLTSPSFAFWFQDPRLKGINH